MAETSPAPARKSSGAALWIALIALISVFALGGYTWYLDQAAKNESAALHQQLSRQLSEERASTGKIKALVENLREENATLTQQLQHNTARLAELPGVERNDWLIAEAEYLLRLAGQRLNLEHDYEGAVSLFRAADGVLAETRNPALSGVRNVIAEELLMLQAIPAVDLTGAVARIQAVQNQIAEIPWMPADKKETKPAEQVEAEQKTVQSWDEFVDYAGNVLADVVRITPQEGPQATPISQDQYYYLQQNMNLMLEQAQVALVRRQNELYQSSIRRTREWIEQYVLVKTELVKAVLSSLAELETWNAAPELPSVNRSLEALDQFLEVQRRNRVVAAPVVTPVAAESE